MTLALASIQTKLAENREVIELLESYLEQARNGELISVAVVGKRPGGAFTTGASACDNRAETAGMLLTMAVRKLGFVDT